MPGLPTATLTSPPESPSPNPIQGFSEFTNPEEKGASTSQKLEDIKEQSVEVHIDSRNIITINDEPLPDPTLLVEKLRQEADNEILITAHELAMHDMLVKVIDAAQEVGMQKIRVGVTRGLE